MSINAMITEDDLLSRAMLCDLLEDHFPQVHIVGMAETVKGSLEILGKTRIDLLFLDIELPDGKGFDILSSLETVDFEVIVTTSHLNYLGAYPSQKIMAVTVKPLTLDSLQNAMNKFIQKFPAGVSLTGSK